MITQEDLARLPRWQIKEPSEREFQEFKKRYLLGKQQSSKEKELLRYIGELQSEVDTLNHALATCQQMTPTQYKEFIKEMIEAEKNAKLPIGKVRRREVDRMRTVLIANNLTW